jgi:hypothetical protein
MSMIGMVFVGFWMSAAYVARRQYVENLRESIHQHRVDSERASMPVMDRDTATLVSSRLKGTTKEIAYALSLFEMATIAVHPPSAASCITTIPGSARPSVARAWLCDGRASSTRCEGSDLGVRTEALPTDGADPRTSSARGAASSRLDQPRWSLPAGLAGRRTRGCEAGLSRMVEIRASRAGRLEAALLSIADTSIASCAPRRRRDIEVRGRRSSRSAR